MRVETFLEDSTARSPGKVALIVGDGRITYAEIDERANRVDHALRERGVRRDDRVLIYLENSAEAVAGIFGTRLSSREWLRQASELGIRCRASKVMTHLGMPVSDKLV